MDKMIFIDEVTGLQFTFLNDFMQHVQLPDGSHVSRLTLFPGSKVNWHAGYMVKADGKIVCSTGANWYITQFEGCDELEITYP